MYRSEKLIALIVAIGIAGCVMPANDTTSVPPPPMPRVTTSQLFNPASYPIIGVYVENLSGQRLAAGTIRAVEDEFMRQVLANGYALAARSDIERIIREQRLQSSGITEEAMARVGRMLNVPAIILVSINSLTAQRTEPPMVHNTRTQYYRVEATMSARMIMTERAEVLWISSYGDGWRFGTQRGNPKEQWPSALQHVAQVVARGLPKRN
jgi:hypothetical protein